MPYKNPDKNRSYQREYQRKRRAANNLKVGITGPRRQTLMTIEDLRVVFERITNEILDSEDLDLGIKGRVLGQLLRVGIDLIEGGSLEQRVSELEKRAELSKYA
jgi:hypothetical protein